MVNYLDLSGLLTAILATFASLLIWHIRTSKTASWIWKLPAVVLVVTICHLVSTVVQDQRSHRFEEKIQGHWLEVFCEPPNERQQYSIACIEYKKFDDQVNSRGYGYSATGEEVSSWTCDAFVPYPRGNRCLLTYTGDIYNVDDNIRGQGEMCFDPLWNKGKGSFQNGSGSFQEAHSQYQKVQYELRRITKELCQELLNRDSIEKKDYKEFIRRYHQKYGGDDEEELSEV